MRVGIFGGSFNPPHVAHLLIAEFIRDRYALDTVVWIPAAMPPHKLEEPMIAARHRHAMAERAVDGNPGFVVSDIEIRREGASYTVDTLSELVREHPDWSLFLLIGSDSFRDLATWKDPARISSMARLLVYPRDLAGLGGLDDFNAEVVDAPVVMISSTVVRDRIRAGRTIRYFVPEPVRRYIRDFGLYSDTLRHVDV